MAGGGNINIQVNDGGSASVVTPGASVQLVIGCSSSGTVNKLFVTRNASALATELGVGPLPEAAALACLAGGTVIAIKVPSNTAGAINTGPAAATISTSTNANPSVATTSAPHGFTTGMIVTIVGSVTNTAINGTFPITVLSPTTFSVPVAGNGVGTGGTATPTGLNETNATTTLGTSAITVTGTPVDTYYVNVLFTTGTGAAGTIASATIPIYYKISLDAGRNYGPTLALGTANSIVLGSTGLTMSLGAGTITNNTLITFGTTEPLPNTAGFQAALNAFQASQYSIQGVGSIHFVSSQGSGASAANCATIHGYLDTLATGYVYNRAFFSARDASPPTAYGGTAETESTWTSSILTDYSATSARRMCVGAAYWNMPTAFPVPGTTGAPALRRPLAWAAAAKQVVIPPQRHNGRVKDGAISQIVVSPITDPLDGFVYHDERLNPGLDYIIAGVGGRFMSTMTRIGLPGVYVTNPLTMSPTGSDFYLMPLGLVMDVFASIIHTVGQQTIDDDVRVNANGTIFENDAKAIESTLANAVNAAMFSTSMISQPVGTGPGAAASGSAITIDRTNNVKSTNNVNLNGTIIARGYVLTITATLAFQNPLAAA